MGSSTAAGSTLAISAGNPASDDATGYAALIFTEVGGIDKIGGLGATYAEVTFTPLKGPVEKHKGSVNYGSLSPTMAYNSSDAGQTLLRTASDDATSKLYSFLVTYPNGDKRYFQGRVFGYPETVDGADTVITAAPTVGISTKIVKVNAS